MIRRHGALLAVLISLATGPLAHAEEPSVEAAAAAELAALGPMLNTKGIVTAKGDRSLAMREGGGGGVLHVVVSRHTRITGLRSTFSAIAVSDIVRVEGTRPTPSRITIAHVVEVLFAVETTERSSAKRGTNLWDWIKNGGVTVDLP